MANLEESAVWTPGVYQLETNDPVLGGPVQPEPATGGIANRAALALANRTKYLKQGLEDVKEDLEQTEQTLQNQIDQKADIDSPAFTGKPKAPTPGANENSDRIATTAYVHTAIATTAIKVFSIASLPTVDIGPILVLEASEVWSWVDTPYYTGYRSPLCGRPVDGHTVIPLASEIDAVGGLLSKTAYAGLWGYAQENDLVVSQTDWSAHIGAHYFVDVSATQFRVPDLRNQFRRYAGTNVDSGDARSAASMQADALQNLVGYFSSRPADGNWPGAITSGSGVFEYTQSAGIDPVNGSTPVSAGMGSQRRLDSTKFDASLVARTSTETRPVNTAYAARIHV